MSMFKRPFLKFLIYSILIFILIYLLNLNQYIFRPIGAILASIAVPIIGAGFLFYITKPLVDLLERAKIKRVFGVLITFLVIIGLITLSIYFIIPVIQDQVNSLVESWPQIEESIENALVMWQNNLEFIPDGVRESIDEFINNIGSYGEGIVTSIFGALGAVFSFLFSFVLIPFFLFFMLKDSHKFIPFVTQFFSPKKAESVHRLLKNTNDTLGSFIQGQMLVSISVGIMLFIGYLIVGLEYALIFAIFALFMNLIPYIGPWLSAIPAVIVGFFQDPMIGVWTAVVMIIVQQIESNLIEPNIMGKILKVHPLTVVVIILALGAMIGFIGFIFAVPIYAVAKTVVIHFYKEYKRYNDQDYIV